MLKAVLRRRGLVEAGDKGWGSAEAVIPSLVAVVTLTAFVLISGATLPPQLMVAAVGIALALCTGLKWFGVRLDPEVYYIDNLPISVNPGDFLAVALAALR